MKTVITFELDKSIILTEAFQECYICIYNASNKLQVKEKGAMRVCPLHRVRVLQSGNR